MGHFRWLQLNNTQAWKWLGYWWLPKTGVRTRLVQRLPNAWVLSQESFLFTVNDILTHAPLINKNKTGYLIPFRILVSKVL